MITFNDVCKSFGKNRVLDHLSLEIPRGKITFIVGKSGEGKSVTIKHIIGLLSPDSGSVVDGQDLSLLSIMELREFRRRCSLLFQHAALFDSLSVAENVLFPLREGKSFHQSQAEEEMRQTLERVGLAGLETKYPNQLSTGEKNESGLRGP